MQAGSAQDFSIAGSLRVDDDEEDDIFAHTTNRERGKKEKRRGKTEEQRLQDPTKRSRSPVSGSVCD